MSQMGQFIGMNSVIETLTGNSGGAITPLLGNINILGTGGLTVTGTPHTLTISGGALAGSFVTDAGTATPAAGVLNVNGGSNINTAGAGNNITINLNNSPAIVGNILMNNANTAGTVGIIKWNGNNFIHNYGSNTFLGALAGNTTLTVGTANQNTGLGTQALEALTTGASNTAIGHSAATTLTTGNDNVAVGYGALPLATTGSDNTSLGYTSLLNLVTGSNNIAVGSAAGNNYTGAEGSNIVIGNRGTAAESNIIRIGTEGSGAGQQNTAYIAGIYNHGVGGTNSLVFIDNNGKLGTTGGTIPYTSSYATDVSGPVSPTSAGLLNVNGVTNQLSTNGGTANTIKIGFVTNPQVTGTLTAGTGLVATTGNISATAGAVSAGTTVTATTTVTGGTGVTATTGDVTATAGNVVITAGNLKLPTTNSGGTNGVILWNNEAYIHNFTNGGTNCFFAGRLAGNIGVTAVGSAQTGVGYAALGSVTSGSNNTAMGAGALGAITTPSNNTALGATALSLITGGAGNIGIGAAAGSSLTGSDSNNIMIGHVGTAGNGGRIRIGTNGTQTTCFIAGIDGVNVGNVAKVVTMASDQLGTATITAGANITITPTANTITIAATGGGGGGMAWSEVTGTSQAMAVANGYILNNVGLVTATLPASASVGDIVAVVGKGSGGWKIAQNSGQTIHIQGSNTTTGATGSLSSTTKYDCAELICITANTDWEVRHSMGNLTVA